MYIEYADVPEPFPVVVEYFEHYYIFSELQTFQFDVKHFFTKLQLTWIIQFDCFIQNENSKKY